MPAAEPERAADAPAGFRRRSVWAGLGLHRLWRALLNSASAGRHLIRREAAVRLEAMLLVLSCPAGWFLARDAGHFVLLAGSLVLLILVEVLNTGIEAACNAVSREFDPDIKLAKDCGSLAVLLAAVLAAAVWGVAACERF